MSKEKKKVLINKVTKRLLEIWPPSVKNGLEDETQIIEFDEKIKVGQGSFGTVFKAKHKKTGTVYAIKAIDKTNKTNQEGRSYFRREIEIMYKIRHPNIVKLYTHFEDNDFCYFVMEYISKGNLYDNIQKQRRKAFDTKTVAHMMKDLLSAVYYLHNMDPPIIHRDIKLENVLVDEDGAIKLTDFGWSNYVFDDEVRDTFCGTPVYQAPEMLNRKEHDFSVDIWCIGIIMFEIITGHLPFNSASKELLEDSIKKVKINWPNDIDRAAKDLISRILRYDPKERISIENMFKHPFFTALYPNPSSCLIKPSPEEELEIYLVSEHTPLTFPPKKEIKAEPDQNISRPAVAEPKNNDVKDSSNNAAEERDLLRAKQKESLIKIKMLQDQLANEQNIKQSLTSRLELIEKEKTYLIAQLNTLKRDKDVIHDEVKTKEALLSSTEEAAKAQLETLQETNSKLLLEIENLNEKLDFQKDFYLNHLQELETQLKKNLDFNQSKIETSISNYRDSLSNMKPSDELDEAKKQFETEIEKLKEVMKKEREKYDFVIQNNIQELNKLSTEKNLIKENSSRYYEKIILRYDERLKQKGTEIDELKLKLKKYEN